jgi:hypothetical protein
MLSHRQRLFILYGVCALSVLVALWVPPFAQSDGYHGFKDDRALGVIPNFWNVVSNAPFFWVGISGLFVLWRGKAQGGLASLRAAYAVFFAAVAATCFGSAYYHWAPSNETLAWDRLPMSIAFGSFVAIMIGEHIDDRVAKRMLWPLIATGVASVWYWDHTERLGRGDLRFYVLVQFLTLAFIALTLVLFPSKLGGKRFIWTMLGGYALAKVCESLDAEIYAATAEQISGHALKHVVAGVGMYAFVVALQRRRPV